MLVQRDVGSVGQRGSALIVSLVFLLLLTMLGVAAMRSSTLQERMAGNSRDVNIAFQAAEAALRAGENVLDQPGTLPLFDNSVAGYRPGVSPMPANYWSSVYDWASNAASENGGSIKYAGNIAGVVEAPRFVIELLRSQKDTGCGVGSNDSTSCSVAYYRITARGVGQSKDTVVILQSTYKAQ
jgi:type IV pilus assembly protein PilX